MANEGLPPVQYVGNAGSWKEAQKRYTQVDVGTVEAPDVRWAEVDYAWIGRNSKWVLEFKGDRYPEGTVTLDNARYFEGPAFRGDVALYGNGLQELPDPIAGSFTGSQYKFQTSPTDTLENYVNFATVSYDSTNSAVDVELADPNYQSPFTIEGLLKFARFEASKGQLFRTVTSGQQGFNWGVGGFFGTLRTNLLPLSTAITCRIPVGALTGFEYTWLWFAGTTTQDDPLATGPCWAGVLVLANGEVRYVRHSDRDPLFVMKIGGAFTFGEWQVIYIQQNATHDFHSLTTNPFTALEQGGTSTGTSRLTGAQFDDAFIGAGPAISISNNTITDPRGNEIRGDLDLYRFYIDTNEELDVARAPLWYSTPFFNLFADKTSDLGVVTTYDITPYVVSLPISQTNRELFIQMPDIVGESAWEVYFESYLGTSTKLPMRITNPTIRTEPLYVGFEDPAVLQEEMLIANKQWGGTGTNGLNVVLLNGGVVKENIEVYPAYKDPVADVDGVLRCYANGQFYTGDITGVDRLGNPSDVKTEVGACIATRDYLGTGSFRFKVRSMVNNGACNCCWTFHYEEVYENDSRYAEFEAYGDNGLSPQGNTDDGFYLVRNNEIDVEWPTALEGATNTEVVDQSLGRMNTWQGELAGEFSDEFQTIINGVMNDGAWHEVGFDWHLNDPSPPINPDTGQPRAAKRVDFYVDGILRQSLETNVPTIAGRFWMGTWFPRAPSNRWTGPSANYSRDSFDIDWFSWTPFDEGVTRAGETYPNDVWRSWDNSVYDFSVTNVLPPFEELPPPVLDDLPKDARGNFVAGTLVPLGANPAQYMGQNRLEFRQDVPNVGAGGAGDLFFSVDPNRQVRLSITVIENFVQGGGIEIVTFEAGNDVVPVVAADGETFIHEFPTRNNAAQTFLLRRPSSDRTYAGRVDIRMDYLD
tara:strand:- start:11471 stop:14248 length:2778 start_codon:yes stop_codon:yes gene_type:complete